MTIEIIRPSNREEWLAARRQDVTASVAASLLGAHPYVTAYGLWAEKTGRLPDDDEDSDAMARGRYLEPVGVAMLRDQRPSWRVEYTGDNTYCRDPERRIGATPDAWGYRPDKPGMGIIQIKSASESAFREQWLDPDTDEVIPPTWIAVQAIVEAKLTDCDWAVVAVVVITWRGNLRLHIVEIPLHDRLWTRLKGAVSAFWMKAADADWHPDPDWLRDGRVILDVYRDAIADRRDLTDDQALNAVVSRYRAAKDTATAAIKEAESLKPQIIYALGNSEAGLTAHWELSAPTQARESYVVQPSIFRALRVKPRKDVVHADF